MQVGFKAVHIRHHKRRVGGSTAVPHSGAWALGLDDEVMHEESIPIGDFEDAKLLRLEERTRSLPDKLRKIVTGETRQFSHDSKVGVCPRGQTAGHTLFRISGSVFPLVRPSLTF